MSDTGNQLRNRLVASARPTGEPQGSPSTNGARPYAERAVTECFVTGLTASPIAGCLAIGDVTFTETHHSHRERPS